jgi:hypothetical protein
MLERECIRHGDKSDARLAPKGDDGRFDLCVAVNGRYDWRDLVRGTPATAALQRETRTIPIVLAGVSEPVASGFVAKLNQPGGNITGFRCGPRIDLYALT